MLCVNDKWVVVFTVCATMLARGGGGKVCGGVESLCRDVACAHYVGV